MESRKESYVLYPDWRTFLVPFVIGVLLIPALGAGIWIIYRYRRKWNQIRYRITNSEIHLRENGRETVFSLMGISSCDLQYHWPDNTFGLGNILIRHAEGTALMRGIPDPEPVASLIEQAAVSERERLKGRQQVKQTAPAYPSGTLDKQNELVGLWQQGLISEEDYNRELKKFQ